MSDLHFASIRINDAQILGTANSGWSDLLECRDASSDEHEQLADQELYRRSVSIQPVSTWDSLPRGGRAQMAFIVCSSSRGSGYSQDLPKVSTYLPFPVHIL